VWAIEEPPAPVAAVVLVDPIVILLELPDVAHGFLYRAPRSASEWLCFLWCTTEPGMSVHFRRRFFWYNCRLDPVVAERTPTLLCLSEHDQLVHAATVRAYAASAMPRVDVAWWKGLGHTSFMASPKCTMQVVRWIEARDLGNHRD